MKNCRLTVLWRVVLGLLILALCSTLLFAADIERRTLELKLGGSDLIKTPHPFKRVSIADPAIADVVVLSPREIYVYGKKVGYTSVMLWEEERGRTVLDVVVSLDLTALKQKLHELYPEQQIEVYASETGVVLSGNVSGPEVIEQVIRLTQTFLPKQAEGEGARPGTGKSYPGSGITNLLKVGGIQQVMLEVKFAEVNRQSTKDWQAALGLAGLGKDFTGAAGTANLFTPIEDALVDVFFPTAGLQSGIFEGAIDGVIQNPSTLLLNFADNAANIFINIDNFTAALELLETEGMARLLAEPRLVTQSGQEASFLAGGEFPIPVTDDDGSVTVEFKEFGVGLNFTPVVLSDGKISLRVAPSVSVTTSDSAVAIGTGGQGIAGTEVFFVPSLSTRKLESNVELYDGQTLALAGLLQDNIRETVSKIPGLGDIPILGSLFKSTSYLQEKTDLLITVTPHLVKPVQEGSIQYPGEFMRPPNWFEFYLEGRLEGRRPSQEGSELGEHNFATSVVPTELQGGLEGVFGHQPIQSQE